ncbi:LytTR family DNA-binding domain-containing protein [Paramaledivibacter caminithermalis]|uniref:LytTR family DNA-binding domain-containing protein n=1 Tax=Paramaledivibacter caminithermalis TaxID=191027 RepID=UPI0009FCF02E
MREELDDSFYQIHRSCIINIKYIKRISKKKNDMYVLMKNNGKYPLSKKYAKKLTEYVKFSS